MFVKQGACHGEQRLGTMVTWMFKLLDLSICLSIYLSIYLIFTSTCFLLLLQLSNPSSVLLPAPSFLIIFSECLCESFQTPLSINMFLPPPPSIHLHMHPLSQRPPSQPLSLFLCVVFWSAAGWQPRPHHSASLSSSSSPSSSAEVVLHDNPISTSLSLLLLTLLPPLFFFSSPHIFVFPTFTPPLHLFSVWPSCLHLYLCAAAQKET